MPRVKLKLLQPGQQLARDVLTSNGRLLLKAGTLLAERHVEIFRTWGVMEVEILGDEPPEEQADLSFDSLPGDAKSRINAHLDYLFRHNDSEHPLLSELIQFQRSRLSRRHRRQGAL